MTGETLLHYRIVERLGAGGMGEVYRAHDREYPRANELRYALRDLTAGRQD